MPIDYEVDEKNNLVRVTASGALTEAEVVAYESAFLADERVKSRFCLLFDATGVTATLGTHETIARLVEMEHASPSRDKFHGSKIAIVFREPVGSDLARLYAQKRFTSVVVFYSMEIARKWLGLEP